MFAAVIAFSISVLWVLSERFLQTSLCLLSIDSAGLNQTSDYDRLWSRMVEGVRDLLASSVAVTIGILMLVLVVWLYRSFVGEGALDILSIAERVLGLIERTRWHASVNIEFRDFCSQRIDLGPYIHGEIRAHRGSAYVLYAGFFVDCDPDGLTPGEIVDVNIQNGLVREELVVHVDFKRNVLYVQSQFTFAQLVAKIHRLPDSNEAPEQTARPSAIASPVVEVTTDT